MEAIRCTLPSCRCDCFSPSKNNLRHCESCNHGWVAHALDKLGYRSMYQLGMQVEIVQPNIVFDIASLMLYGSHAAPIRLKILLDRLFSVLQHEEVLQILHGFGWSYEDYARGYILQDASGVVLDKWKLTTREEEQIILQQFMRFGETKSIAQDIILQDARENREKHLLSTPKTESEIKKFLERSSVGIQSFMRGYDPHPFVARPLHFPHSPINATGRMLSPPTMPNFASANRDAAAAVALALPVSSASPGANSPLSRLSSMQPFNYRRDQISPTVSPSTSEKSLPPTSSDSKSPQNLSIVSQELRQATPVHTHLPSVPSATKSECSEDMKFIPPPSIGEIKHEITTEGVLNFSTKDCDNASSLYADQKAKHLRKSNNPMKRPWQPTPGYGGTLIGPGGKKRVLCTACNKTFCDKGALKIHYSAVHLKEMHKCTVEGCNMMFSSRRSRNRHSANPNPKLHMPQNRRKLPDGAIVLEDKHPPLHLPTSLPGMICSNPSQNTLAPLTGICLDGKSPGDSKDEDDDAMSTDSMLHRAYYMDPSGEVTPVIPSQANTCTVDTDDDDDEPMSGLDEDTQEPVVTRSKRKSLVPTRCTQMEEIFVMSDENSNDGLSIADTCSRADVASGVEDLDKSRSFESHSKEDTESQQHPKESEQDAIGDSQNKPQISEGHLNELAPEAKDFPSYVKPCFDEIKEKAMRQMQSISETHLKDVIENDRSDPAERGDKHPETAVSDLSVNTSSASGANSEEKTNDVDAVAAPFTPDRSMKSASESEEDDEEADYREDEMEDDHSMGLCNGDVDMDDARSISPGLDIPYDKDNPRRCSSCGKMFQNHFGVKTHYQNVHLKLMHTCTVEGCNAAFPSKRSRDRHSSNMNLHRKLLSTASSDNEELGPRGVLGQSLREEFLPMIYESQQFPTGTFTQPPVRYDDGHDINTTLNLSTNGGNNSAVASSDPPSPAHGTTNGIESLASQPNELPLLVTAVNGDNDKNGDNYDAPQPDPDGAVTCHVCQQPFRDNLVLKEHFEKVHPKEMFRCTIHGCDKIFSTRKSRNRHSQNDNLHRHLPPTITPNGTV